MQVYNNDDTSSVWKSYTANDANLRGSITRLSNDLRSTTKGNPSDLSTSQAMSSKYRDAVANAAETENNINSLQTIDAWMQKTQAILSDMSEVAGSSSDSSGSTDGSAQIQGQFGMMQQELMRVGQNRQGQVLKGTGFASAATPSWYSTLCSTNLDPSSPDGSKTVSDAARDGVADLDAKRKIVSDEMKSSESALAEIRSQIANMRATGSGIQNIELAQETAQSAGGSIVTEVGTALLAQANALPGSVMNLVAPTSG